MRTTAGLIAILALAGGAPASPASAQTAQTVPCSVFARHPCRPPGTGCSVFQRRPCIPDILYPFGQDLRLTIESVSKDQPPKDTPPVEGGVASTGADDSSGKEAQASAQGTEHAEHEHPEHKLNTILDLYGALRACWEPPAQEQSRPGMQMSVRFSFKRDGEIIGTPRVTYTTPDAKAAVRQTYHDAITQALNRCTPLPFSAGLGGAVA